jgi:hypothetical protein
LFQRIYINDNRRQCPTRKGGRYGMNLTIVLLLLWLRVFDKIFGTLAENLLFTIVGSMVPQYYFRILASFLLQMQNDKLKVTSIFI